MDVSFFSLLAWSESHGASRLMLSGVDGNRRSWPCDNPYRHRQGFGKSIREFERKLVKHRAVETDVWEFVCSQRSPSKQKTTRVLIRSHPCRGVCFLRNNARCWVQKGWREVLPSGLWVVSKFVTVSVIVKCGVTAASNSGESCLRLETDFDSEHPCEYETGCCSS